MPIISPGIIVHQDQKRNVLLANNRQPCRLIRSKWPTISTQAAAQKTDGSRALTSTPSNRRLKRQLRLKITTHLVKYSLQTTSIQIRSTDIVNNQSVRIIRISVNIPNLTRLTCLLLKQPTLSIVAI